MKSLRKEKKVLFEIKLFLIKHVHNQMMIQIFLIL
jgi:hypothetical protein